MGKIEELIEKFVGKNRIVFFIVVALLCILAIVLGIYSQYFYKYSSTDPLMLGIHIGKSKSAEEYSELKANFLNTFTNELHINSESIKIDKINTSQPVIYTGYTVQNEDEAFYNVDLKLPILNIDKDSAKEINSAIKTRFYDTAEKIMRSSSSYNMYKVSYVAYVNESIVSIVIKETRKTGNASETTTVVSYNYDISSHKQIDLKKLLKLKSLGEDEVQNSIISTIKTAASNASALASEYGVTVDRNPDDEMYKISNTTVYFLTEDGYIYIVYPYGETTETNEMDIIIF